MPRIKAAGTTFAYRERGAGPDTLLFMHGYLGSGVVWRDAIEQLAGRYRCIALDARGVGDSDRPHDGYTIDTWTADTLAVSDALGIERFSYVTHSMGSLTGYRLALDHPDRLSALVLTCPSPAGPPRAGRDAFAPFRAAWADDDAITMSHLLAATSVALPDTSVTELRASIAIRSAAGHVDGLLDDATDVDLRPRLGEITTPTLLVLGAADPALAAGLADFARLGNATLDVMSGAGHVPQLERPAAYADTVGRFLDDGVITFATLRERMAHIAGADVDTEP